MFWLSFFSVYAPMAQAFCFPLRAYCIEFHDL